MNLNFSKNSEIIKMTFASMHLFAALTDQRVFREPAKSPHLVFAVAAHQTCPKLVFNSFSQTYFRQVQEKLFFREE